MSSRHFFLVVVFNLLNYINLGRIYYGFHNDARFQAYLPGFILLVVFLINYAAYYLLGLYRLVKQEFSKHDLQEESSSVLLQVSYFAFRLYLTGLCISFVILASFLYSMK